MTARTERERPIHTCCVKGCGNLASYHLDATVHGASDHERKLPRLTLQTGLIVCQAHRDQPVHTCIEFFGPPQREYLDALCRSQGVDVPNYDTAEWAFPPILVPADEVKH